ncbi:MAG: hypothetical protein JSR58_06370 [Verrucomicrobia bacterium]|nr:hypothetical protein [Verrucomicrobiota bacterium]
MPGYYFSVVIPVADGSVHLLPLTLDLLAQQKSKFEVIIVDGTHRGISLKGMAFPVQRIPLPSSHLFTLMNAALPIAQGKYVQFLLPGEFYMSTQSLSWIEECARGYAEPDLITSGYFVRHRFEAPTPMLDPLTIECLKRAEVAPTLEPYWFKTETLQLMGKFSTKYDQKAGLDVLCRFFAAPQLKKAHLRRIVTDYEYRRPRTSTVAKEFSETAAISFKHYGIHFHFFVWMGRSYLRLVRWCAKMLKRCFWQRHAIS